MDNKNIIFFTAAELKPEILAQIISGCTPEEIKAARENAFDWIPKSCPMDMERAVLTAVAAQQLHTYGEWKANGRQVKRGEKAVCACYLWKYSDKPSKDLKAKRAAEGTDPEKADPHFSKVKAYLFASYQTEKAAPVKSKEDLAEYNRMLREQWNNRKAV